MENKEYKYIYLPNGDYIVIKFDIEGVVYDRFNKDDEQIQRELCRLLDVGDNTLNIVNEIINRNLNKLKR